MSTVIESIPAASIKNAYATPQFITCSVKSIVKPIRNFVSMKMHIQLVKLWKVLIAFEWIHGVTLKVIGWQPTK